MSEQKQDKDFISSSGTAMTVAAWIAFFILLIFIFDDLLMQRINPNQNIVTTDLGHTREIELLRNTQGHYVATGTINRSPVTFLLDTGATDVAIPDHIADALGLRRGQAITVKTANGNALAFRTRLDSVALGEMERRDVRATILSNMPGNQVLLGMSYLKQFELIQRGDTLTIRQ
jgi:aspartyl protease family protein